MTKIAIVLPRGMFFGPDRATAIDLCVHDSVRHSAFRETTRVFGVAVDRPFEGVPFTGISTTTDRPIHDFVQAIAAWKPDLIVVHQHLKSARAIARACPATPVILYKHNSMRISGFRLKSLWKRRQLNAFAHIVFVSRFCETAFLQDFGVEASRTSTIYNGLDVAEWTAREDREKTVVFAGRATPEKGGLEAASALSCALRDHADWRADFLLSTLDENQDYLEAVRRAIVPLGERARIRTDVPFATVKESMEAASIVLVPSVFDEPFGRTAIEAMAGGAALMSSFRGGLAEVCGDAAQKICPEDISAFSDAISDLIRDPERRADLSARGRRRVEQLFSIQATAGSLDSLYLRLHSEIL
ncbi:glycosyltransferase family 4 protein [Stappia sp. ES.058]|uniref:glycosyltransferase family 4 protein n=1 Tax=Stappia sp. ES.058 TaxID=1881061 RepID=UPI00087D4BB9|nr:glycosyltransferase family 4 protein [Stappia sp. ES.058]SDU39951.1 Glycosyltransferase involved in cell wall bisynthesis [Stappia sp. ES.058]